MEIARRSLDWMGCWGRENLALLDKMADSDDCACEEFTERHGAEVELARVAVAVSDAEDYSYPLGDVLQVVREACSRDWVQRW